MQHTGREVVGSGDPSGGGDTGVRRGRGCGDGGSNEPTLTCSGSATSGGGRWGLLVPVCYRGEVDGEGRADHEQVCGCGWGHVFWWEGALCVQRVCMQRVCMEVCFWWCARWSTPPCVCL